MAIKSSNRITFTEHKKILKINEYYLATALSEGVTTDTSGWTTDIQSMDSTKKYLWNYEETVYSLGEPDTTNPVIIGVYGEAGASLQVKYISSATAPTIVNNNVSAWSDAMPTQQDGRNIYMTQKMSNQTNWSTPIQISSMAAPTITIVSGYWYINGESTGIKAEGKDGDSPNITIGNNGNWYINGIDSGNKAEGPAGQDGASVEYVYYRSAEAVSSLESPSYANGILTTGWTQSPQGITVTHKYEYVSVRTKPIGGVWGSFSAPVIWSKWGEKGQDGDGIEYRYYLSNSDKKPTYVDGDSSWTDEPSGVSIDNQYEYVVQIKLTNNTTTISEPALWAKYGERGYSLQIKYMNSAIAPTITNNNVTTWSDTIPAPETGKKTYMTQKLSSETNWSTPIQISGTDGKDGIVDVKINDNGYWVINGETTGVKAKGEDGDPGHTPTIEIINGYWVIDGNSSNVKAEGEAGKDGSDIEYVYYRNNTGDTPATPSYNSSNQLTTGWFASPQGITSTNKYEFVSIRTKPAGSTQWGAFSAPVVWSKWGEKGQDGDGVEYKYYLNNSGKTPTYSATDATWTDDPTGVSITQQYEYVVQIKTSNGTSTVSSPSLWAKYGEDGKGITSITNYYATTTVVDTAPTQWDTTVPELTPTNKYLWNYEYITYTDNSHTSTTPAIIGAYGDSGIDAVMFEIYSVHGFMFKSDITSIELKTAAFEGSNAIQGAVFAWFYWDRNTEAYVTIDGATTASLVVADTNAYATDSLKCTMTYKGKMYEDYVKLSRETTVYTSVVNFFNGNNVLGADDLYIVAYVEVYRNNELVETIAADKYCDGISTVSSSGIITSNLSGNFVNGDKQYFIYKNAQGLYDIVLGVYSAGQWKTQSVSLQYTYENTFSHIQSNVVVIPKESVNKSQFVDFTVFKDGLQISSTNATVIDTNDPVISSTAPNNPRKGQLWLDTSAQPSVLKMFEVASVDDQGHWVVCTEQRGKTVYTSKPVSYDVGDLWILSDGENCGSFGPGSMLRATASSSTYNDAHWIDADAATTELKNNINQTFKFNPTEDESKGLKGLTIGQGDEQFYVNINSQEMGLYDNSNQQNQKVVYIKNNAATIQNTNLKGNTNVYGTLNMCDPTADPEDNTSDALFVWKIEQNRSLSLAVAK